MPDGVEAEDFPGGPPQNEKLDHGPDTSAFGLVQTEEDFAADAPAAVREDDTNEVRRGESPEAGPFFAVEPATPAKDGSSWHLARMVTTDTAPQPAAYFRDARFVLLGIMNPDGSISVIEPLTPPPPDPPAQGELS
jgi:hypothetical protein